MNRNLMILILLISIPFLSCKHECPKSSRYYNLHSYPYLIAEDHVSYVDSAGNILQYNLIKHNVKDTTFQVSHDIKREDSYCWESNIFYTNEETNINYLEQTNHDTIKYCLTADYMKELEISISINNFIDTVNYIPYYDTITGFNVQYIDSITFFGKSFTDVYKITDNDCDEYIIFKPYDGIVGFEKNIIGSKVFYRRE